MLIADFTDRLEIAGHRRRGPQRRTDNGFGDERDQAVRAETLDLRDQLGHESPAVRLPRSPPAVSRDTDSTVPHG